MYILVLLAKGQKKPLSCGIFLFKGDNDKHCHWLNYGPQRYLDVLLVPGMLLSMVKGTLQRWPSEGFTEMERLPWIILVGHHASFPPGQVNIGVLDLEPPSFLTFRGRSFLFKLMLLAI